MCKFVSKVYEITYPYSTLSDYMCTMYDNPFVRTSYMFCVKRHMDTF